MFKKSAINTGNRNSSENAANRYSEPFLVPVVLYQLSVMINYSCYGGKDNIYSIGTPAIHGTPAPTTPLPPIPGGGNGLAKSGGANTPRIP
jgi:hypothetical protein